MRSATSTRRIRVREETDTLALPPGHYTLLLVNEAGYARCVDSVASSRGEEDPAHCRQSPEVKPDEVTRENTDVNVVSHGGALGCYRAYSAAWLKRRSQMTTRPADTSRTWQTSGPPVPEGTGSAHCAHPASSTSSRV